MSADRKLSAAEQEFLKNYLEALTAEKIRWIILRNYEDFPEKIGHDLDLFIPRAELDRATGVFRRLLKEKSGRVFIVHERDYFRDIRFTLEDHRPPQIITLDLYHGAFTWHGLPYLEEEVLIESARLFRGLRVPRPAHEALNLALASILWGSFFKERYQTRIAELLSDSEERHEFDSCFFRAFGPGLGLPFDPSFTNIPKKEAVRASAKAFRLALKREHFRQRPWRTLCQTARYWLTELQTLRDPRGISVAVLGPDGAGKSTLLAAIERDLELLFGEVQRHHWRPQIIPDVGVLLRRREASDAPNVNPHGQTPHSPVVSFLRLLYYLADYWIGYFPRVLKRKAQVHLVLFDRYAPDMECDPRRYRLNLPPRMLHFLCGLAPEPDFSFFLIADPETVAKRKGEVSVEKAAELVAHYRKAAGERHGRFAVDAAQPVDKVIEQVESRICEFLLERESKHQN